MKNVILLFFIFFFRYYIPVLQATIFVPRSRGTKIVASSFSSVTCLNRAIRCASRATSRGDWTLSTGAAATVRHAARFLKLAFLSPLS